MLPFAHMDCSVTIRVAQQGVSTRAQINLACLCFALGLGFQCSYRICHHQRVPQEANVPGIPAACPSDLLDSAQDGAASLL